MANRDGRTKVGVAIFSVLFPKEISHSRGKKMKFQTFGKWKLSIQTMEIVYFKENLASARIFSEFSVEIYQKIH